jgi:type I restriction enzyme S subunit
MFCATITNPKKIAHILSTLDDKIELNRKMNQTLEAMAQALFKSWFVDFDPVHVRLRCKSDEELKVAARELGISKEVLELFPSEV